MLRVVAVGENRVYNSSSYPIKIIITNEYADATLSLAKKN